MKPPKTKDSEEIISKVKKLKPGDKLYINDRSKPLKVLKNYQKYGFNDTLYYLLKGNGTEYALSIYKNYRPALYVGDDFYFTKEDRFDENEVKLQTAPASNEKVRKCFFDTRDVCSECYEDKFYHQKFREYYCPRCE